MSITKKPISVLIDRMIPKHIVEEYPSYVRFIQAYFEHLESQFGEYDMISNILGYGDVDNATLVPEFFTEFKKQYIGVLPGNLAADSVLLIKNIRSFYRAKGTEDSFRFLFRALYDKEIQFYYPSKDMLRVSDGKWTVPTYIVTTEQNTTILQTWVGSSFSNQAGTASGIMESFQQIDDPQNPGTSVYAFLLSNIVGTFASGDVLVAADATLSNLIVSSYNTFTGYWKGTDGMISSDKKIQDSFYYQDFSYELQTDLSISQYQDLIKRVIHPAGMAMFGKFTVFDGTVVNIPAVNSITNWLLQWEQTLNLLPSVGNITTLLNDVLVYARSYWTYGLIESARETRLVTDRYPNIADFRNIHINEFASPSALFSYLPSPTVTII